MVTSRQECINDGFRKGGSLCLLGDLYLENETLHVTNWDQHLRYSDSVNGSTVYYSPAPFWVSDDLGSFDTRETSVIKIFFGIAPKDDTSTETNFTAAQLSQFSDLMSDLDEYLDQNDIRGALVVLRIVNPNDLSSDEHLFTGLVDDYDPSGEGISIEVANAVDVLNAPAYPVSTTCPYIFGDDRCQVDRDSAANKYTGTASDGSASTIVDASITPATDGYWNIGVIKMTSGSNKGVSRDVQSYDSSTNTITVSVPFFYAVVSGDTFELRRKCKKTYNFCNNVFDNVINFGGYESLNEPIQGLYWRGKL